MAYSNALAAYRQTRIKTAGQGQLIIMLYDGAVMNIDRALELIKMPSGKKRDPARIEQISKAVLKSQEIITELMVSLDFEKGGEIASNLFSIYTWFNKELLEANMSFDEERLMSVRKMICDLRGAWVEVIALTAADERKATPQGVSLAG
ncbi:MAG: flagellar export chaperone FliS [Spirochaetaceae bacterium]|nr:flagellar export chaperone FliS [Spirochaetaceae bacterium]GMO27702.1 MAG: flagellar export chaperone FliS [Termitinemataceae bacterium]